MMIDTEIIERYFKARGWEKRQFEKSSTWYGPFPSNKSGFAPKGLTLPLILTDFPAFKEQVLEVMEKEKLKMEVYKAPHSRLFMFRWIYGETQLYEPIKNNNILHAAVQSATRYFEGQRK